MEHQYIVSTLANWYLQHKRDLPWRETQDPYLIWISEIILQQTRVNQGLDYYLRFVQRFPDVRQLDIAHEDEVLKYWQGLGYYSRARNLHKAARRIVELYDGVFPTRFEDVLSLPGIGSYTASAICSFAYHQPYAVLDGNVFRVLSRLFGIDVPIDSSKGKKIFEKYAADLMIHAAPALHNQAIMEFGALQCVPVTPDCVSCPLHSICVAYGDGLQSRLPVKEKKLKQRERFFNYLWVQYDDCIFLQKRIEKDIWQNLYELPLLEADVLYSPESLMENESFKALFAEFTVEVNSHVHTFRHILSHQIIHARFFKIKLSGQSEKSLLFMKIKIPETDKYAVSGLVEKGIRALFSD